MRKDCAIEQIQTRKQADIAVVTVEIMLALNRYDSLRFSPKHIEGLESGVNWTISAKATRLLMS